MESRNFKAMSEKNVKKLMRKLVKAVQYMHKRNVVHRDLKLENIIIGHQEKMLKIIDFGMSEKLLSEKQLSFRWCGSTDYVCPEILTRTPYSGFKGKDSKCSFTNDLQ